MSKMFRIAVFLATFLMQPKQTITRAVSLREHVGADHLTFITRTVGLQMQEEKTICHPKLHSSG